MASIKLLSAKTIRAKGTLGTVARARGAKPGQHCFLTQQSLPEVCFGTASRARGPIYLYNIGVGHGNRCPRSVPAWQGVPEVLSGTKNRARGLIYLYNIGVGHDNRCPSNFAGTESVTGARRCD